MVFEEQLGSGWLREVLFSTEMLACWGEHEDAAATILATGMTGGQGASENMGGSTQNHPQLQSLRQERMF